MSESGQSSLPAIDVSVRSSVRPAAPSLFARTIRPYLHLPPSVLILCFGSFVNRAGSFALLFMTIYVSEHLGFGVTFAANCFGIYGLGSMVASVVGGQLADRFGRRVIMLVALTGGVVSLLAISAASARWEFLLLMFSFSVTMEMYRPAASAMIGDLVDTKERPLAFGLLYIAYNLGFAVAAPVGGFIAEYSFRWLFWADAITTGGYALIILLAIRETHPQRAPKGVVVESESVGWSQAIRCILRDTRFLLFSLAVLLTGVVFMQGFSTLPIHLTQLGYSKEQIGLLLSANGALIVLLQIPLTHLLNRFHRITVILVGEVLIAIGFGMTAFVVAWQLLLCSVVVWTVGEVVQAAFKQSTVADLAPADMRARYMGVFGLCHGFGLTFGVPLGGWVLDRFGPAVLWAGCFACSMAAAFVYLVILRRQDT